MVFLVLFFCSFWLTAIDFLFLIEKVNQIGSVTESIKAVKMSKHAGWGVMASHRRYDMLLFSDTKVNVVYHFIIYVILLFNAVVKLRILS